MSASVDSFMTLTLGQSRASSVDARSTPHAAAPISAPGAPAPRRSRPVVVDETDRAGLNDRREPRVDQIDGKRDEPSARRPRQSHEQLRLPAARRAEDAHGTRRQPRLLEQLRQRTLDGTFDMSNRRRGCCGGGTTRPPPCFEAMRLTATPEVDEIVSARMELVQRVTTTHPSCVFVQTAGRRDDHRDRLPGREIDRMTAIGHHESIGDTFNARHSRERRAPVQNHRRRSARPSGAIFSATIDGSCCDF